MQLTVNGKGFEIEREMTIPDFLELRGVRIKQIAVAINGEVIDRETYAEVVLRDGDVVEIVRMVGGG